MFRMECAAFAFLALRKKTESFFWYLPRSGAITCTTGQKSRHYGGKRMKRKRFIKLLMGKFLLTRNEANYVAEIVRISDRRKS